MYQNFCANETRKKAQWLQIQKCLLLDNIYQNEENFVFYTFMVVKRILEFFKRVNKQQTNMTIRGNY